MFFLSLFPSYALFLSVLPSLLPLFCSWEKYYISGSVIGNKAGVVLSEFMNNSTKDIELLLPIFLYFTFLRNFIYILCHNETICIKVKRLSFLVQPSFI